MTPAEYLTREFRPTFDPDTHEESAYAGYLQLADVALREEQERIKQKIRPHVERYKQLTGKAKTARVG